MRIVMGVDVERVLRQLRGRAEELAEDVEIRRARPRHPDRRLTSARLRERRERHERERRR